MEANGPLSGLRVLDLTHAVAGPYGTMLLADMGADVIKVEKPLGGDLVRNLGSPLEGTPDKDYFFSVNRNKQSVAIDMKEQRGRDLVLELGSHADVVVQNLRPGAAERLGLGFEDLQAVRPDVIYCGVTGFGPTGPWASRSANDTIIQSTSGLMSMTGEPNGAPVRIGPPIIDLATGIYLYGAVVTALLQREQHPEGQHISISMLDVAFSMMANYIPAAATRGEEIPRMGRGHAQIAPYDAFTCGDGRALIVGAFNENSWRGLCEVIDQQEWLDDPRYKTNADRLEHRGELTADLEAIFGTAPLDEWADKLEAAGVIANPVYPLHEVIQSEQAKANGNPVAIELDDGRVAHTAKDPMTSTSWPLQPTRRPPGLGQHTDGVLSGLLGLDESRLSALEAQGVIRRV
ncbi:CoA transferase [Acidimicrobiia bacterium EGI L10123]|nr:CoA transferase [Acidimicrobiia bacterium EGI L10123]